MERERVRVYDGRATVFNCKLPVLTISDVKIPTPAHTKKLAKLILLFVLWQQEKKKVIERNLNFHSHFSRGYNSNISQGVYHKPTESSKQPIRARYLGHVTGYQPIRDQYFLVRSVPSVYHKHGVSNIWGNLEVVGEMCDS